MNKLKNSDDNTDNLILDNSTENKQMLVFKVCLPKDANLLAIAISSNTKCKKALIDQLDTQDEVLQP